MFDVLVEDLDVVVADAACAQAARDDAFELSHLLDIEAEMHEPLPFRFSVKAVIGRQLTDP